jgi:hypothetical protein
MKPYETPELLEIGAAENVVLGEKIDLPEDSAADPTRVEPASFLDVDE